MLRTVQVVNWLITALALGSTLVGSYVAYQAYRGFRRNESRAMEYLSVGLLLLTGVGFSVSFVGSVLLRQGLLAPAYRQPLTLLVRFVQFLGVAFIAYSLHRRP